jgi:hypothetical protein
VLIPISHVLSCAPTARAYPTTARAMCSDSHLIGRDDDDENSRDEYPGRSDFQRQLTGKRADVIHVDCDTIEN